MQSSKIVCEYTTETSMEHCEFDGTVLSHWHRHKSTYQVVKKMEVESSRGEGRAGLLHFVPGAGTLESPFILDSQFSTLASSDDSNEDYANMPPSPAATSEKCKKVVKLKKAVPVNHVRQSRRIATKSVSAGFVTKARKVTPTKYLIMTGEKILHQNSIWSNKLFATKVRKFTTEFHSFGFGKVGGEIGQEQLLVQKEKNDMTEKMNDIASRIENYTKFRVTSLNAGGMATKLFAPHEKDEEHTRGHLLSVIWYLVLAAAPGPTGEQYVFEQASYSSTDEIPAVDFYGIQVLFQKKRALRDELISVTIRKYSDEREEEERQALRDKCMSSGAASSKYSNERKKDESVTQMNNRVVNYVSTLRDDYNQCVASERNQRPHMARLASRSGLVFQGINGYGNHLLEVMTVIKNLNVKVNQLSLKGLEEEIKGWGKVTAIRISDLIRKNGWFRKLQFIIDERDDDDLFITTGKLSSTSYYVTMWCTQREL